MGWDGLQGPIFGPVLGSKNGPGEAKLAPRGAQEGMKKHQSDERGDVQKTRKKHGF